MLIETPQGPGDRYHFPVPLAFSHFGLTACTFISEIHSRVFHIRNHLFGFSLLFHILLYPKLSVSVSCKVVSYIRDSIVMCQIAVEETRVPEDYRFSKAYI